MTHHSRHATGTLGSLTAITVILLLAAFTTSAQAASAPTIDSESSSNVTPIKATLEAQVNPNNEATTACTFEYGTTNAYGKTAPCEQGTLEGFGDQTASAIATELEPATTYHFRLLVENATGTTEGADTEFTTPAKVAPLIDSESVSSIAPFSTTLEAQINPDDQLSTFSFEYATNEALTGATVLPGESGLSGFGDQGASVAIGSLTRGTTYFYRAIAKNETGETQGPVQSFTTIGLPSVDDVAATATSITHRGVRLAGTVNPGGSATTFHFDYGTSSAYGSGTPEAPAGEGTEDIAVGPQAISELQPATLYHYRLVATSAAGSSDGADYTFTTAPTLAPLVSTGGASSVSSNSATIAGTVDPQGLPSGYEFDLGIDTGYGSRIFGPVGEAPETLQLGLSSLAPGTTYHYRLCAFNEDGTSCGADETFATPGRPLELTPGASSPLIAFPAAVLAELAAAGARGDAGPAPKPPTKAQKLKRALKACAKKPKRKRTSCRRQAIRRYR
jgi:hypothetical protein